MRLNPVDALLFSALRLVSLFDRRERDAGAFDPGAVKNILVVSSTAIGDTLLSTPAMRAVRRRYPGARIIALLNRKNMALFEANPDIDGIVPYCGGYRRFLRTAMRLRSYGFDLAVVLHGNEPQATPLCYLSGARFIFKLPNTSRFNFLLSNRWPIEPMNTLGHAIDMRLKTVSLAGCAPAGRRMELGVLEGSDARVEELLGREGVTHTETVVGMQPGAADVYKMWPAERFIELGRRLAEKHGARVVVTGSPAERELCERVAEGIGAGAVATAGHVQLADMPALIRRFAVLVTGDTGPMHVAVAVETPVVAMFAATSSKGIGPTQDEALHTVIQKEFDCTPCVTKRCTDPRCMEEITVDEVYRAVCARLAALASEGVGSGA